MPRALFAAIIGCIVSASAPSLAVDPAGGPPEPPDSNEELIGPDAPDASINERSWLGEAAAADQGGQPLGAGSSAGSGLTLGALIILLGLGGAAIALHFKRQKTLPISKSESRLDVISSSRIGPKAYAVTAHVGGRVMLLGVTDHNVTLLTWLDTDASDDAAAEDDGQGDASDDDLPEDYPGSALRQDSAPPSSEPRPSSIHPKKPFATSHDLKRFQEVLRGAMHSRSSAPLSRAPLSSPPSAASTLAAQTSDVIFSGSIPARASVQPQESPTGPAALLTSSRPSAAPASLRRKRQRRNENAATRANAKVAGSGDADPSNFEGQVAGLERLKGGGPKP